MTSFQRKRLSSPPVITGRSSEPQQIPSFFVPPGSTAASSSLPAKDPRPVETNQEPQKQLQLFLTGLPSAQVQVPDSQTPIPRQSHKNSQSSSSPEVDGREIHTTLPFPIIPKPQSTSDSDSPRHVVALVVSLISACRRSKCALSLTFILSFSSLQSSHPRQREILLIHSTTYFVVVHCRIGIPNSSLWPAYLSHCHSGHLSSLWYLFTNVHLSARRTRPASSLLACQIARGALSVLTQHWSLVDFRPTWIYPLPTVSPNLPLTVLVARPPPPDKAPVAGCECTYTPPRPATPAAFPA